LKVNKGYVLEERRQQSPSAPDLNHHGCRDVEIQTRRSLFRRGFLCELTIISPLLSSLIFCNEQGRVYKATDKTTGEWVALKKSRASKRVKRPILLHEIRVLQLLQGHTAIPSVYGYGHLPHFEYMAMELLGPSIAEKQKDDAAVMATTVIRVLDQTVCRIRI
jgi:hypothetical protein